MGSVERVKKEIPEIRISHSRNQLSIQAANPGENSFMSRWTGCLNINVDNKDVNASEVKVRMKN